MPANPVSVSRKLPYLLSRSWPTATGCRIGRHGDMVDKDAGYLQVGQKVLPSLLIVDLLL
jgi:hypothetical protein